MLPITIKLAGTSQPEAQQNICQLGNAKTRSYQLDREPNNHFDPNAIRVTIAGRLLGYVPRQTASALAPMMDLGLEVMAELVKVNSSPYHDILGLTVRIDAVDTDSQDYLNFLDNYLLMTNKFPEIRGGIGNLTVILAIEELFH